MQPTRRRRHEQPMAHQPMLTIMPLFTMTGVSKESVLGNSLSFIGVYIARLYRPTNASQNFISCLHTLPAKTGNFSLFVF